MLQLFRKIIGSRYGAVGGVAFLVLIALAFAGTDVANMLKGPQNSPTDAVAAVGDQKVDAAMLSQAANSALQNIRQEQPTVSMQAFVAAGQLEQVLDNLIDRAALTVWGTKHGVVVSERLVDSEIAKAPAFQGADGKFDQKLFRQMMQQRGMSEQSVRRDIAETLIARQMLVPASFGATMPHSLAMRYAELLKEKREGFIAALPAQLFVPAQTPDEKTLAAFYQSHRKTFIRPERRTIRYAVLSDTDLKSVTAPTDAEIAARFKADADKYAATETRSITQFVVLTEADARAAAAEVAQGKPLAAVAQAKGLSASTKVAVSRTVFAAETSPALADAVFAAAKGAVVGPVKDALGWHVAHVDAVTAVPARSLAQVKGEIATALTAEKHRLAIADAAKRVEDQFDAHVGLADAVKPFGLAIQQAGPLTADGQVYGQTGKAAPPELAKLLQTAFAMDQEHQPQLAEIEAGKRFVLYEVQDIVASAPAPFAEIKQDVAAAYAVEKGNASAGEAAKQVLKQIKGGSDLAKALASLGRPLPPPQLVVMTRDQLAQMQQQSRQQVPPPLALLFSMAQGTTKLLPAPGNRGWFLVSLKQITPGVVTANDPLIASAQRELGQVLGNEYTVALRGAIRNEAGVTRNAAALSAVRRQLGGTAGEP